MGDFVIAAALWLLLAIIWALRGLYWIGTLVLSPTLAGKAAPAKTSGPFSRAVVLLNGPLLLAAAFLLVKVDAPMRLAMWISEPALQAEADRVAADERGPLPPGSYASHRIGLFEISDCKLGGYEVSADTVVFTFASRDFPWGTRGLYYNPQPVAFSGKTAWYAPHHIQGPWYWWEYSGW